MVQLGHRGRAAARVVLCSAALCCGCGLLNGYSSTGVRKEGKGEPISQAELQQDMQRFTSQFMGRVTQAAAPLTESEQPARREMGSRLALGYMSSSLDIASGQYPEINMLDMLVFVKLSGDTLEGYWIPEKLGNEGRALLTEFRASEKQLWGLSSKILSARQQADLRGVIREWQAKHPDQYQVEDVRFTQFSERAGEVSKEREESARGLLGQVRSATRVADQAVLLGERALFVVHHMPFLARLQARVGVQETISDIVRLGNLQALLRQAPKLRPVLEQSVTLANQSADAAREAQAVATAFKPYLEWLSAPRDGSGPPVPLQKTLESANELSDTSLALVRELRAAAPEDARGMVASLEQRVHRWTRQVFVYLVLLGLCWSLLFWSGYYLVKHLTDRARISAAARARGPGEPGER